MAVILFEPFQSLQNDCTFLQKLRFYTSRLDLPVDLHASGPGLGIPKTIQQLGICRGPPRPPVVRVRPSSGSPLDWYTAGCASSQLYQLDPFRNLRGSRYSGRLTSRFLDTELYAICLEAALAADLNTA